MPDTGLNLANLKEHLRKNMALYIVGLVLTMVVTNLLWTSTAPQIPTSESVILYLIDAYTDGSMLDDIAADMLARGQEYDETLRQVEFQNLMFSDPENNYMSMMVLMARLAVAECDVFLASGDAMDRLISSGAILPLDGYYEAGWLSEFGLEPYYATVQYEEGGETQTLLAGFKLDGVSALRDRSAFNNEGAFLALSNASDNLETAMRTVEIMLEDLTNPNFKAGGDAA